MARIVDGSLEHVNTLFDEGSRTLDGAFGVEILQVGTRTFAYVAGINDDGISIFEMGPDGALTFQSSIGDVSATALNGAANFASATIGGSTYLYANGAFDDGLTTFRVRADGGLDFVGSVFDDTLLELNGSEGQLSVVTNSGGTFLLAAGYQDSGVSAFRINADGTLANTDNVDDTESNVFLSGAASTATATVAGNAYAFVSSYLNDAVSAFRLGTDGTLSLTDTVLNSGSLELHEAYGLATATAGGNTYLFVAGQFSDGISVFSITSQGALINVFNVTDTAELGLNGATGLKAFQLGGEQFLSVSGANDDAISYFRIEANGSLTMVETVFDTVDIALNTTLFSDFVNIDGTGYLVATGRDNDGVSSFSIGSGDTTLIGTALADEIFGYAGNDTLNGLGGEDLLDGGTGSDSLVGGAANDTYIVDRQGDTITETAGGGTADHVRTSASYTLAGAANIEKFSAFSAASTLSINLTGNQLAQEIIGNAGKNVLTDGGPGGAGDVLRGLAGNDIYRVFSSDTRVLEAVARGSDIVQTAVSYVLAADSEIERLATTSASGTTAIDLTGNQFAQEIIGNAGTNFLRDGGVGGAGDVLRGLGGDDFYRIYSADTVVVEGVGEGTADRVLAGVSYVLGAGVQVETLATSSVSTTLAINLTGNALRQDILGNAGNNVLQDGGGAGDSMRGLDGDDIYRIFSSATTVTESASQGSADRVVVGVDYVLGSGVAVEFLHTTGSTGTAAIDLRGNEFAQTVAGNAGSNIIDGKGGSDTLRGFAGNDFFVFSSALGPTNVDTILDFDFSADTIRLENAIFTALTTLGTLSQAAFKTNTTGNADDSTDRIIYNSDTGALFYDADGTGGIQRVQFASVAPDLAISNLDFVVI